MAYMMRYFLAFYSLALLAPDSLLHAKSQEFDVLVYGATPAGVCAAVAASREGASVALVSPYAYVGGMISGGLSMLTIGSAVRPGPACQLAGRGLRMNST